ncbi:hypothetical protein HDU86_006905 [Geranomyces michiganensis]|nr:hypothetical protein HDU86_006905 [Geranomyces michiganensis]
MAPLFALLIATAAVLSAGPSPAAAVDINCVGFQVNNVCYTDPRLRQCVDTQAPNWPFAGPKIDASAPKPKCPSPVDDPKGFDACLKAGLPQDLPNATAIVEGCINSTGVQPASTLATAGSAGAANAAVGSGRPAGIAAAAAALIVVVVWVL